MEYPSDKDKYTYLFLKLKEDFDKSEMEEKDFFCFLINLSLIQAMQEDMSVKCLKNSLQSAIHLYFEDYLEEKKNVKE